MNEPVLQIAQGLAIPFLGTVLGAACVFFMKKQMGQNLKRGFLSFAAGVMVAASVWSLLLPAISASESMGKLAFIPATVGFWAGILFLYVLDKITPHLHLGSATPEGPKAKLKRTTMLTLAVTLHNLPEGMAVGIVFAGWLSGNVAITLSGAFALATLAVTLHNLPEGMAVGIVFAGWLSGNVAITLSGAFALAIGIAIQNFPEGAVVSLPLRAEGCRRGFPQKGFRLGSALRSRRTRRRVNHAACG